MSFNFIYANELNYLYAANSSVGTGHIPDWYVIVLVQVFVFSEGVLETQSYLKHFSFMQVAIKVLIWITSIYQLKSVLVTQVLIWDDLDYVS